ncbi:hypothetical protein E6W36_14165 [Hankyongella ginsenosidimutans]|uniref:Uncharacterized protein n=1 Tax=Hankyongella ginsenosidimutans TaxID=1763828 RepID=A0A4D7CAA5_9SPHN|nr:hypothetical protein [Hankyongella ginsenosidimutans]QCI80237.1 hypothetical protein E6W36_14165 [Hankyongella ginsenosidimutans]
MFLTFYTQKHCQALEVQRLADGEDGKAGSGDKNVETIRWLMILLAVESPYPLVLYLFFLSSLNENVIYDG